MKVISPQRVQDVMELCWAGAPKDRAADVEQLEMLPVVHEEDAGRPHSYQQEWGVEEKRWIRPRGGLGEHSIANCHEPPEPDVLARLTPGSQKGAVRVRGTGDLRDLARRELPRAAQRERLCLLANSLG